MNGRMLRALPVVVMLGCGCATTGAHAKDEKPGAQQAGALAMDGASMKRRRAQIASMLEGNMLFKGIIDGGAPKLANAKFAGPFGTRMPQELFYCASAEIVPPFAWPLHTTRTAVIQVKRGDNGSEAVHTRIPINWVPGECHNAKYGPFPEIEHLRMKRRQALGKKDS